MPVANEVAVAVTTYRRPELLSKLLAHLLVQCEAARVRRDRVRIFLSTGESGHGAVKARWTFEFGNELSDLHIPHELWLLPPRERDHLWRAQLPAAIDYASPGATREKSPG